MKLLVTGCPAVGKTTFCRARFPKFLDFDDYVEERFHAGKVGSSTLFQSTNGEWDRYVDHISEHGYEVVCDCVPTVESRARYVEAFHPLAILYLYSDLPTLLERNDKRGQDKISTQLLLERYFSQELPTGGEGYMAIYLKKMEDGSVAALGDEETVRLYGGTYDSVISEDEWIAAEYIARIGDDGSIVLGKTDEEKRVENENSVRFERNRLLRACDKISPMRWNEMDDATKEAWTAYRRNLLDIPQTEGFPWNGPTDTPWPKMPD